MAARSLYLNRYEDLWLLTVRTQLERHKFLRTTLRETRKATMDEK